MENLDSREKPGSPPYFTRGASGRVVPHGLLVVACRQSSVDPRFRHGSRACLSAGLSAALLGRWVNLESIANLLLSCWGGRMPGSPKCGCTEVGRSSTTTISIQ